jgi:hypothetical protein
MNQKSQILLLQMVKALKANNWSSDSQWELSLKADGNVPLMRAVAVKGSLDGEEWKDQIHTMIRATITTDDEITFFPEFTLYAQIAIGNIPAKDIEYKMAGNVAFSDKDLKNDKKFHSATREINRMVDNYVQELYQDYVDVNEDLVKFYKQSNSQPENNNPPGA